MAAADLDLARAIKIALAIWMVPPPVPAGLRGHVHYARSSLTHRTGHNVWTGHDQFKEPLAGGSSARDDASPPRRYGDKAHDLPHAQRNPIKLCRNYADDEDDYSRPTRTAGV